MRVSAGRGKVVGRPCCEGPLGTSRAAQGRGLGPWRGAPRGLPAPLSPPGAGSRAAGGRGAPRDRAGLGLGGSSRAGSPEPRMQGEREDAALGENQLAVRDVLRRGTFLSFQNERETLFSGATAREYLRVFTARRPQRPRAPGSGVVGLICSVWSRHANKPFPGACWDQRLLAETGGTGVPAPQVSSGLGRLRAA